MAYVRQSEITITGEVDAGTILITVGLETKLTCEDKRAIPAEILKKLIRKTQELGRLYYIWFRESEEEEEKFSENAV